MKKIIAIIGARPQFIKHAPVQMAIKESNLAIELKSIHTGQHYDENMSDVFFKELGLAPPDYMLEIGSHRHGRQTGRMMEKIEDVVVKEKPSAILVYGDTNSTLAGALVAAKLQIPIIHVEAGLRSFNRAMPEEINRVMTDHLSDILIAPTDVAVKNLENEGITEGVFRTGDIMLDMLELAMESGLVKDSADAGNYLLATIHRPYNTDKESRLRSILDCLNGQQLPVKCPMHPRTVNLAKSFGIDLERFTRIEVLPPASYFENLNLMYNARAIITDSGGVQKEAYFLKKQCVTLRPETEWVETLQNGWNTLVFEHLERVKEILGTPPGAYIEDLYGSGNAREELVSILATL